MRKKQEVTIQERRRSGDIVTRIGDIFERKFDGFPAKMPPKTKRAGDLGEGDIFGINLQKLIKDILSQDVVIPDVDIPPCPDDSDDCESICEDTFTRNVSNGWGDSEIMNLPWLPADNSPRVAVTGNAAQCTGLANLAFRIQTLGINQTADFHATGPFEFEADVVMVQLVSSTTGQIRFEKRGGPEPYNYIQLVANNSTLSLQIVPPTITMQSVTLTSNLGDWQGVSWKVRGIWDSRSGVTKAKAWNANDPEPDWLITAGESPVDFVGFDPAIYFQNSGASSAFSFFIDRYAILQGLDCDSGGCYDSGGIYTSILTPDGSGNYILPAAARRIVTAYFDGLLQSPGYDYTLDPDGVTVTTLTEVDTDTQAVIKFIAL